MFPGIVNQTQSNQISIHGFSQIEFGNQIKSKVKPWSRWFITARAYLRFCSIKQLEVFLLPPDGTLVHCRPLPRNLLGFPNNSPLPIYTPGWREVLWELSVLPKNTTQCPWPGLEPRPLIPGTSTLTMRPPRLLKSNSHKNNWTIKLNRTFDVQTMGTSQVAHQAGTYPGFCSRKQLGVFLLPPGWDASPSQDYPQQ